MNNYPSPLQTSRTNQISDIPLSDGCGKSCPIKSVSSYDEKREGKPNGIEESQSKLEKITSSTVKES